jgi:integrase
MKHLTRDELRALLTVAKAHSERDHLMILTGFWHGLRCSEIVKMRGTQIRDGYLTVQRLKGSLKTTQPLVSNADPLLDEKTAMEQRAEYVGDGLMFPISRSQFWRVIRKHAAEAGIAAHKRRPHVLKHTCGMMSIKAGIEHARQYLGHKNIASTGAYLCVDDDAASKAVATAAVDFL